MGGQNKELWDQIGLFLSLLLAHANSVTLKKLLQP